ncbi:fimbrial protein [Xenorhabdus hominickii]|uniref:Fimbrial adaptor, MrxG n=1 Tax=Xenorhabdus hominickii TaxID=351679 RepID=A0A2G0QD38_XENHO|nr:fimbrial protein [Xenorhabdus hominickii]AOM41263.1 pilus assembly protein [Xenorhabdus hominickii]PHM55483.1 Fimbrial adaptor, MrxG [Xenorhabdus hominickii]PHM57152.1 Fimbrial adaptor, MrxG [Xenorhabdus hominickii]
MSQLSIKLSRYALLVLFLFGVAGQQSAYAKDNLSQDVKITLTVLAPTCSIKAEDKSMEVEFGSILNSDLYLRHRTIAKPFYLRLENCDPRITKRLKIKFSGQTSSELPDLLAFSSASSAKGAAIGMEKVDGTPMPFNKTSEFPLLANSRNNVIPFRAYVQAEPSALQRKKISTGPFSATATFEVNYD